MTDLKILIVDDEPLAVRRLEIAVERIEGVTCAGTASGCAEAHEQYAALNPDILLLDIRMRDGTGFEFLDRLPDLATPAIIFVTAFDAFAVRAFETCAVDYVLKPVETSRLAAAIARARDKIEATEAAQEVGGLKAIIEQLRAGMRAARKSEEEEIWAPLRGGDYARVPIGSIRVAKSEGEYVRIFTGERSYLIRISLTRLANKFPSDAFIRVHRNAIVRINAIRSVQFKPLGGADISLENGDMLLAGRIYAKQLRRTLLRPDQRARKIEISGFARGLNEAATRLQT